MSPRHLPREEQIALVARAQRGDRHARNELIRTNQGLIQNRMYRLRRLIREHKDDALVDGMMGLNHAIDKFDPARGCALSTYASNWIDAHLRRGAQERNGIVHVPIWVQDKQERRDEVVRMQSPVFLDAPVSAGGETSRLDLLRSSGPSQEEQLGEAEERKLAGDQVRAAVKQLRTREQIVIDLRYLVDFPLTLDEVGARLGVTRERTRQIEEKALKRLARRLGVVKTAAEIRAALSTYGVERERAPGAKPPPFVDLAQRCSKCAKRLNAQNTAGVCSQCVPTGSVRRRLAAQLAVVPTLPAVTSGAPATQEIHMDTKKCSKGCGAVLGANNKSGICTPCQQGKTRPVAVTKPAPVAQLAPKPKRAPPRPPVQQDLPGVALQRVELPALKDLPTEFLAACVGELRRRQAVIVAALREAEAPARTPSAA